MRKKMIIIALSVFAFVAAAAGGFIWMKHIVETPMPTPQALPSPRPPLAVHLEDVKVNATDNLKAALEQNAIVDEAGVVALMHGMTHQKIIADMKWNSVKLTQERADLLVQVIEKKSQDWTRKKDELLRIARRWAAGDFSEIDKEHNYLWEQQEGTVGKATGLATPEQEQEFIRNEFPNED